MACPYDIEEYGDEELIPALAEFVEMTMLGDVGSMMRAENKDSCYSLSASFLELIDASMPLGTFLVHHPKKLLECFEKAVGEVQEKCFPEFLESWENGDIPDLAWPPTKKTKFHVRITNLPVNQDSTKGSLPRSCDIGRFVCVRGTVIRTGQPKMLEWKRVYKCALCHNEFEKEADLTAQDPFPYPVRCESGMTPACTGRKFTLVQQSTEVECHDYQEIKIQEQMHTLGVGSIPRSIHVIMMEDLVDVMKPGDDVTITGEVIQKWKNLFPDERCDVEIMIKANNIRINNQDVRGEGVTDELQNEFIDFWKRHDMDHRLTGRDVILKSLCPEMFGSAIVKLAVAMILVGGVQQKNAESTTKQRGESHLLLVGDPGTGKSQFLKYASKIATRSVLTTGIGTTTAGLTVSAVKDKGGDWILEAGALVLADGGICCIDEFGSIQEKDKTSIHEAMEQQTLSIAKAGLICNLQTRCSIIAATNPKGKYDPDEDLSINLAMGSPLLSRFDVVLIMMDQVDLDWDRTVSDFILRGDRNSPIPVNPDCWSLEKLQAYFSHCKAKWAPSLTEEARATLSRYYQRQRAADLRNVARITIRMLESLIRIAEAHAKLVYRGTVELQDAIVAIIVMEYSIAGTGILGSPSVVRSLFPDDPEADYREKEEIILKTLSLTEFLRRPATQRR